MIPFARLAGLWTRSRPHARDNAPDDRFWRAAAVALFVVLAGAMLATFRDYGLTWDEGLQNRYSHRLVRWYATLGADSSAAQQNDLYLYGGVFELAAALAQEISPLGVYETRHLLNAAFGFMGVVAAWGIGVELSGALAGFLSALFLAATPVFYGHAFANPKDLPFAALFALAVWTALRASRPQPHRRWRAVLVTGIFVGLAAGVRVAGIVLCLAVALLWPCGAWLRSRIASGRPDPRGVARTAVAAVVASLVGWTVMVAAWPWAQLDPICNPIRAFGRISRYWEGVPMLFDGQLVTSGSVSRAYIPKLLGLTLPEFYPLALLLGGVGLLTTLRNPPLDRSGAWRGFRILWVTVLAAAPIAWAIANHTPLYNGYRHLLFVIPLLAVLAGTAVASHLRGPAPRSVRAFSAAGLIAALLLTIADMVQLHPYQYLYFNRLFAGGVAAAVDRYDLDYWGASYKEGIEWMVRRYDRAGLREQVRVAGYASHVPFWYYLSRLPGGGAFRAVTLDQEPHLVFATTANRDPDRTPGRILHVVERQGAPLLYIIQVRPPE